MIKSGQVSISVTAGNTQFQGANQVLTGFKDPVVICCLSDTGPFMTTGYMNAMAWCVTQNGFTPFIKAYPGATVITSTVTLFWIAAERS